MFQQYLSNKKVKCICVLTFEDQIHARVVKSLTVIVKCIWVLTLGDEIHARLVKYLT